MNRLSFYGFGCISLAAVLSTASVFAADVPRWGSPKMNDNMILQVQYQQPVPPQIPVPVVKPMSDSQRDTIFKELRPQFTPPPAGATNTPLAVEGTTTTQPFVQQKRDTYISNSEADSSVVEKVVNPQATKNNSESLLPNPPKAPLPGSNYYEVAKLKEIECPKSMDLKPIREIGYDIRPTSDELPKECPLQTIPYSGRHFAQTCYQWKASALCTKAAYFEDVQLERYGHSICPVLEPVISGVRFFLTVPFLPYKAGLIPPNECVYTLGHYRAGNCSPYMLDPLPISVRAILFEGAAVGGAIALLP